MATDTGRNSAVVVCVIVVSLSVVALGATVATQTALAQTSDADLEFLSVDVPETMEPGTRYAVSATVRNTGDDAKQVRFGYVFAGDMALFNNVIIAAGERRTKEFSIRLSDVAESYPGRLADGEYEHGMRAGDVQVTREVTVRGLGTPTPTPTVSGAPLDGESVGGNGDVSFVDTYVPSVVPVDERTTVSARIEYTGAERRTVNLYLGVDGAPNFRKTVALDPGDRKFVEFEFESGRLSAGGDALEPGAVYDWQLSVRPETDDGSDVAPTLAEASGEFGYGTPTDQGSGATDSDTDAGRSRGFFTNSGGAPGVLGDAFNLTVLGFLLSVVGIIHQLLGGR
jgi:hypothetical protein